MFSTDDTIVAIATPAGRGGIGVVRLSGSSATAIAAKVMTRREALTPRLATLTRVRVSRLGSVVDGDQALVTWFPAPHSYTGEHVVEISAHGSPVVLRGIVDSLIDAGARLARPGEFTFRAFLNSRVDLAQAEAVADLIDAATPLQAQVAFDQLQGTLSARIGELDRALLDVIARLEASLDFPDEGFHFIERDEVASRLAEVIGELNAVLAHEARGRLIREGANVVIAGRVNAGKSSLFNALIGRERAIVTDVPGTTRDLLTERIDVDGVEITLVDTAGERHTEDLVEREGVSRANRARESADLTLLVIDSGEDLTEVDHVLLEQTQSTPRVIVASKADRDARWAIDSAVRVSTAESTGLDTLRHEILTRLMQEESLRDPVAITNQRHVMLLKEARAILAGISSTVNEAPDTPEEFVLADLHRARASLGEVVGIGSSDDTLDYIFSHFCIGK
jgi:tRNA modification GTPase